jgi:hypothetical protein
MRASALPISSSTTIQEFYSLMDKYALGLLKEHEIVEGWLRFKSLTKIATEIQHAQWEVEVFLFSFRGNRLFSFSTSNGKEIGELKEYPDLIELQVEAFEYMKQRAIKADSNVLKARYNHILWFNASKKNKSYAENAIKYYIASINDYYSLILKEVVKENTFELGRLYENLIGLVNEVKFSVKELKELTDFLLIQEDKLPFYTKHGILDDMLQYPKIFKANDFSNVLTLFEKRLTSKEDEEGDFTLVNYHLPSAIKISKKIKGDVTKWYNEIGNSYLRMASREVDDERNWIKLDFFSKAIDAYRKAGNKEKKNEVEQLYFLLKPNVKLDEYKVDFDEERIKKIKEFNGELKEKAKNILKETPINVYSIIANGSFFPKYKDVLTSKNKEPSFLDGVTTVYFDSNKNITTPNQEDNEKYELLKTYGMRVNETLLPFLHYILIQGIKSGHLTAKNFIEFLVQNTWIGKPVINYDLGGHPEQTNWAMLIIPAIADFFNQVLSWGESKYYIPTFILCIDSLALKIEGLFRSFSERINISTSVGKKKGMQETLLNNILENEVILKYFNEDDRLFFEYVFSDKGGLNLRNNVAHSFYNENQYHPNEMLLLLAVVLRLGKYNIKKA